MNDGAGVGVGVGAAAMLLISEKAPETLGFLKPKTPLMGKLILK